MSQNEHRSRIGYLGSRFGWGALGLLAVSLFFKELRIWFIIALFGLLAAMGFLVSWLGERRYKNIKPIEVDEHGNARKRIL